MSDDDHPVEALINTLGGATLLARRLSHLDRDGKRFPEGTIGAWKCRRSIPVRYWGRLLEVAKLFGINGVTEKSLIAAHQYRAPSAKGQALSGSAGSEATHAR